MASVKDKHKCIQGLPFRFYSCWMCGWQNIDNIYASFQVIIDCVYTGLFLLVFRDFDIIMHGWQYNYILLTTFIFINLSNRPDLLFCVRNIHADLSSLPVTGFNSLGMPWPSCFMAPTMMTFFSRAQVVKETDVKLRSVDILIPWLHYTDSLLMRYLE